MPTPPATMAAASAPTVRQAAAIAASASEYRISSAPTCHRRHTTWIHLHTSLPLTRNRRVESSTALGVNPHRRKETPDARCRTINLEGVDGTLWQRRLNQSRPLDFFFENYHSNLSVSTNLKYIPLSLMPYKIKGRFRIACRYFLRIIFMLKLHVILF